MDLNSILKIADRHARTECARKNLKVTEDLQQEIRLAVWLYADKHPSISKTMIRKIAREKVVDEIRSALATRRHCPKILHMSLKGWQEVQAKEPEEEKVSIDRYGQKMAKILPLMRMGYTIKEISRQLGMSKSVVYRRVATLRALLKEANRE